MQKTVSERKSRDQKNWTVFAPRLQSKLAALVKLCIIGPLLVGETVVATLGFGMYAWEMRCGSFSFHKKTQRRSVVL